jgi:hypothetical protein
MDGNRFDTLAKMVGRGASRRSILKGLLGLGGASITGATISNDAGARGRGSRPTIPPPPPPTTTTTTPAPTTTTAETCTGFRCGLDCCDEEFECCDGECCPAGTVCLARVFGEGPFVEEETCCPEELTCRDAATGEGLCCDGECFDPELIVNDSVLPLQVDPFERTCCPEGGEVCPGSEGTLCCQGDTPQCCRRNGVAFCIAADACCTDADCDAQDDPANCLEGVCTDEFVCEAQSVCGSGENCCEGGDDVCCPAEQECCGPVCCDAGEECCERTTAAGELIQTCIDPLTQCCTNPDCFAPPFNFDRGCVACPAQGPNANTCVVRNDGEDCNGIDCGICFQGQCLDRCPDLCGTCTDSECVSNCDPLNCQTCSGGECIVDCPEDLPACDGQGKCVQCALGDGQTTCPECYNCNGDLFVCEPAEICLLDIEEFGFCCDFVCQPDPCPTTTTTTAAPTTTTTAPEVCDPPCNDCQICFLAGCRDNCGVLAGECTFCDPGSETCQISSNGSPCSTAEFFGVCCGGSCTDVDFCPATTTTTTAPVTTTTSAPTTTTSEPPTTTTSPPATTTTTAAPTTTTAPPPVTTTTVEPATTTQPPVTTTAAPNCIPAVCAQNNSCLGTTWSSFTCQSDLCVRFDQVCPTDIDPCTETRCDPAAGCSQPIVEDGTIVANGVCCDSGTFVFGASACPNSSSCTTGTICQSGICHESVCVPCIPDGEGPCQDGQCCDGFFCNASSLCVPR